MTLARSSTLFNTIIGSFAQVSVAVTDPGVVETSEINLDVHKRPYYYYYLRSVASWHRLAE